MRRRAMGRKKDRVNRLDQGCLGVAPADGGTILIAAIKPDM
jgi:hypothetical protein